MNATIQFHYLAWTDIKKSQQFQGMLMVENGFVVKACSDLDHKVGLAFESVIHEMNQQETLVSHTQMQQAQ